MSNYRREDDGRPAHPALAHWQLLAIAAGAASLLLLLAAGVTLSANELGRSAVNPGCDASLLMGLLLLAAAGSLLGGARLLADLRFVHELWWDPIRLAVTVPAPAFALLLAGPNFLGCKAAIGFERWAAIGDALLGTPGLVLAGAAAFGLGIALTSALRVQLPATLLVAEYERLQAGGGLGLVDRALAAHDLLEAGSSLPEPLHEPEPQAAPVAPEPDAPPAPAPPAQPTDGSS